MYGQSSNKQTSKQTNELANTNRNQAKESRKKCGADGEMQTNK